MQKSFTSKRLHERSSHGGRRLAHSLVGQEVGRQGRQIIRARVHVTLSTRPVVLEDNDGPTPRSPGFTLSDVSDRGVDRYTVRERFRRIPDLHRKAEGFPVETLGEGDALGNFGKLGPQQRHRATSIRRR
jgi:hypothetical protein